MRCIFAPLDSLLNEMNKFLRLQGQRPPQRYSLTVTPRPLVLVYVCLIIAFLYVCIVIHMVKKNKNKNKYMSLGIKNIFTSWRASFAFAHFIHLSDQEVYRSCNLFQDIYLFFTIYFYCHKNKLRSDIKPCIWTWKWLTYGTRNKFREQHKM